MAEHTAVDVHAHGIPRSLLDEIRRNGERYGGMAVADGEQGPVVSLPGGKKLRPLAAKMLDEGYAKFVAARFLQCLEYRHDVFPEQPRCCSV